MKFIRYSRLTTWLVGLGVLALFSTIIFSLIGQRANASVPPQEDFKVTTGFLVRHAENAAEPRPDPPLWKPESPGQSCSRASWRNLE